MLAKLPRMYCGEMCWHPSPTDVKTYHANVTFSVISRKVFSSRYLMEGRVRFAEIRGKLQV